MKIEHQKDFEFKQDPTNPLTDEQIHAYFLNEYLDLFPVYDDKNKYENSVFVIKNMGKITATVKTRKISKPA